MKKLSSPFSAPFPLPTISCLSSANHKGEVQLVKTCCSKKNVPSDLFLFFAGCLHIKFPLLQSQNHFPHQWIPPHAYGKKKKIQPNYLRGKWLFLQSFVELMKPWLSHFLQSSLSLLGSLHAMLDLNVSVLPSLACYLKALLCTVDGLQQSFSHSFDV